MATAEYDVILAECLNRLARGENVADCLARHPQHAAELEPPLVAAEALIRIGAYRLPEPARARARARLRGALAERESRPAWLWRIGWARGLTAAAVALLLIVLVGSAAAGSRPGDWAYPFRAAAERAAAGWNDFANRLRFQSPPDFAETPQPPTPPVMEQKTPAQGATRPALIRPLPTRTPTASPTLEPATVALTPTPTSTLTPTATLEPPEATATPQPPRATPTDDGSRRTRTPGPSAPTETPKPGDGGFGPGAGGDPGSGDAPGPGGGDGPGSGNAPGPGDDSPGPGNPGPNGAPEP